MIDEVNEEKGDADGVFEEGGDKPLTAVRVDELEGLGKSKGSLDGYPAERRKRIAAGIAAVRSKSPGIELWHMGSEANADSGVWDVLLRCPNEHEFAETIGKAAEKRNKAPDAMKRLAYQVVVWPPVEEFRELVKRRPGLPMKIANDALAIASEEDPDFARKV